jgi:hypothetical protein
MSPGRPPPGCEQKPSDKEEEQKEKEKWKSEWDKVKSRPDQNADDHCSEWKSHMLHVLVLLKSLSAVDELRNFFI